MISLRWILLLAGLLFIVGLALWEMRRSRQAAGSRTVRNEPVMEEPASSPAPPATAPRSNDVGRPLPVVEWPQAEDESDAVVDTLPVVEAPVAAVDKPILDWPPEGVRRICNLRLMPRADRFAGRALRQSLLACGFAHGEFGIFHLTGIGNRIIVSAANLARPGMLDPDNMDYQRFGGINLFTVLPAPMPDHEALDQLFATGERLAERLDGVLQDGEGRALDTAGLAALRQNMLDRSGPNAAAGGG